jgi:hypothetical protein
MSFRSFDSLIYASLIHTFWPIHIKLLLHISTSIVRSVQIQSQIHEYSHKYMSTVLEVTAFQQYPRISHYLFNDISL